ncbi:MAG: hypothetical protein VKI83_12155 [Synechococcaceae cyanobacterium]|nr:hypothetical protein [Synechococcaceae cyanobacterium]
MKLTELLLAGAIVQAAAGGSLQLLGLAAGASLSDRRHLESWQQLDAEFLADEQLLRRQQRPQPPVADCGAEAARLQALLTARPLAAGLQRQWQRPSGGDLLQLSLRPDASGTPRTRLLDPAALGFCRPAPAGAER